MMIALNHYQLCFKCFVVLGHVCIVSSAAKVASDSSIGLYDYQHWVAIFAVSAVSLALMVVYILMTCGDCYNSEVSSENHPATGHSAPKWGGAGGYSAAASAHTDRVLGAGFAGEVFVPRYNGSEPLPYTVIPMQVPESQGFQGYQPSRGQGPSENVAASLSRTGYPPGSDGREVISQRLPGAHISPVMQEEAPPPYQSYS